MTQTRSDLCHFTSCPFHRLVFGDVTRNRLIENKVRVCRRTSRACRALKPGWSKLTHLNSIAVSRITTRLTAPSRATGNRLPGKRPHGNRIRAGGLSAASSAPVSHFLTRWCASHWRVDFLPRSGSDQNKSGKLHGTPFLGVFAEDYYIFIQILIFLFLITARIVLHSAVMDIMIAVQDACVSGQWLTAIILSLCCFLPSCLPAGQTVDYASSESVVSRQGDTALLR